MTGVNLIPQIKFRYTDNNGNPLVNGKVFTYVTGTTTMLGTYTDSSGTVLNTNPIILDARGEADIFLKAGKAYRITVKDENDVLIETTDKVYGAAPAGGDGWIDVTAYGAIGDGVVDDTAAFQAAINAAASSAESVPLGQGVNKTLYIPAGQYIITSDLTLPGRVNIIGDGTNSSIVNYTSVTGVLFRATADISYSSFSKMKWTGPGEGTGNPAMGFQGYLSAANIFVHFKEMIIEKFPQCAIYMNDSFACTFEDMDIKRCGTVGTIASGNADLCSDSYGGGIRLSKITFISGASTGNKYLNSYIRKCGRGIYVDGNERVTNTFFLNMFLEENYIGIDVDGRGAATPSRDTTLYTTYFEANLYAGANIGEGTAIGCYRNNTTSGTGLPGSTSKSGPDGINFDYRYNELYDSRFSVGNKAAVVTVGTTAAFRVDKTVTTNNIVEANFDDAAIKFGIAAERDVGIYAGQGTPNGNVTANSGSVYVRRNSSAAENGHVFVKLTDAANTGWQPLDATIVTDSAMPTADGSNKGMRVYNTDRLRTQISNGSGVWREYNGLTDVRGTLAGTPTHYEGARYYASDIDALLISNGSTWRVAYKEPVFVSAVNGGTTSIGARGGEVINTTATTIASHTVTLPSGTNAVSGDKVIFVTYGAITALTVNTGAGTVTNPPTTLATGTSFEYTYNSSATTWYRVR